MKRLSKWRGIVAFLLVLAMVTHVVPLGAENLDGEGWSVFYSDAIHIPETDEEEAPEAEERPIYTFGSEQQILLSELLDQLALPLDSLLTLQVSVSDSESVSLKREIGFFSYDYRITALTYFDQVLLTVSTRRSSYEIVLRNPAPMDAGFPVTGEAGTFMADTAVPADTVLTVADYTPGAEEIALLAAVTDEEAQVAWLDLSLMANGREVETGAAVQLHVDLALPEAPARAGYVGHTALRELHLFHFTDAGLEELPASATIEDERITTVSFVTKSFSPFVVVYTVDFEYDINGQPYTFSLPGGGYVTLRQLINLLGLLEGTEFEDAESFLSEVERVGFSAPDLVSVSHLEEDSTVGAIKERLALECEYSAELTSEQIKAIDTSVVSAGDWVLINLKAFDTEETLTITMRSGEVLTVQVTDAQISTKVLLNDGKLYTVTVTYEEDANIPDGATLSVTPYDFASAEYEAAYQQVMADKVEKGEISYDEDICLAAFDLSIMDADGNKVEPAAPVLVELKINEINGVDNLDEIEDTLVIHHHVMTADGTQVETVAEGSTDVTFSAKSFSTFSLYWDNNTGAEQSYIRWRFENTSTIGTLAVKYVLVDKDKKIVSYINSPKDSFPVNNDNTWEQRLIFTGNIAQSKDQTIDLVLSSGAYTHTVDGNTTTGSNPTIEPSDANHTLVGVYYSLKDGVLSDEITKLHSYFSAYSYAHETGYAVFLDLLNDESNTPIASLNPGYVTKTQGWTVPCATLYVAYEASDPNVTVHHGYMENGKFVEFESKPWGSDPQTSSGEYKYLIYDFDGYYYSSAHLNTFDGTKIQPVLHRKISGTEIGQYQYCTSLTSTGSNGWEDFSTTENHDVYVVYEKRTTPTKGGSPTVQTQTTSELEDPTIKKDSISSGDGTNTLSLSITGRAVDQEAEKLADVIVVMDISDSMVRNSDLGDSRTRMAWAKEAANTLAENLLSKVNGSGAPLVRMSLVSFGDYATVVYGLGQNSTEAGSTVSNITAFQAAVNGLGTLSNTNWEAALEMANTLPLDSGRASIVIFITDGKPTMRITRGNNSNGVNFTDSELINGNIGGGMNNVSARRWGMFGSGGEGDKNVEISYNYALPIAQSIVAQGKYFYTVGMSSGIEILNRFASEASAGSNSSRVASYSVTSGDSLTAAFSDIEAKILAQIGWSNIHMTDGITDLTSMYAKSDRLAGNGFEYWIAPKPEGWDNWTTEQRAAYVPEASDFTRWTLPASCNPATYNSNTGAVEWNMGPNFLLQDGVTYRVSWKVWPSQEAYDTLARLNNGTLSYDDLSDDVKAQMIESGNSYTLKTNKDDPKTTYQQAEQKEGKVTLTGDVKTLPFGSVDNLALSSSSITVEKKWENNLDSRSGVDPVTIDIKAGSEVYKSVTLSNDKGWSSSAAISCGLMKVEGNVLTIYELGHDFQLSEQKSSDYYWELETETYRPMIINSNTAITMLVKTTAPEGMGTADVYAADGKTYYRIGDNVYCTTDTASSVMTATNKRRSNLNLTKTVVDEDGKAVSTNQMFDFSITVTDTNGQDVWFSVQDESGKTVYVTTSATPETRTVSGYTYDSGTKTYTYTYAGNKYTVPAADDGTGGKTLTGYYSATSGTAITVSMKQGWNLRFTNLPIGTTYSIQETELETGYEFVGAVIDNGGEISVSGMTATGAITEADKQYTVTVTNESSIPPTVSKTITGRKVLEGRELRAGDQFTFKLVPATEETKRYPGFGKDDENALITTNDSVGAFSFTLNFSYQDYVDAQKTDDVATFTYLVTEAPPEGVESGSIDPATGIKYSKEQFWVQVDLTYERGQLKVSEPRIYTESPLQTARTMVARTGWHS